MNIIIKSIALIMFCTFIGTITQIVIPDLYWKSDEYKTHLSKINELKEWESKYIEKYKLFEAERYLLNGEIYPTDMDGEKDQTIILMRSFFYFEDKDLPAKERAKIAREKILRMYIANKNINHVVCYPGIQCLFTDHLSSFNDLDYLLRSFSGENLNKFSFPEKPNVTNFVGDKYTKPWWYVYAVIALNIFMLFVGFYSSMKYNCKNLFSKVDNVVKFSVYRKHICSHCGK